MNKENEGIVFMTADGPLKKLNASQSLGYHVQKAVIMTNHCKMIRIITYFTPNKGSCIHTMPVPFTIYP